MDEPDVVQDSSTGTVLSIAIGYRLPVHKIFVGSLRATGYKGHIVLGVSEDTGQDVLDYLHAQGVTVKLLHRSCVQMRWANYPLGRDWLKDCPTCTGPVLITDVRDMLFQQDPFQGARIKGLMSFEEHPSVKVGKHYVAAPPIPRCKGVRLPEDKPMLCSGTTIGTRAAMLDYLDRMYSEMRTWIADKEKCHFDKNYYDQAIHNYLYYFPNATFAFKDATAFPYNTGIVGTLAIVGGKMFKPVKEKVTTYYENRLSPKETAALDYAFETGNKSWCNTPLRKPIMEVTQLTDEEGYFVDAYGKRYRMVHQINRFGEPFMKWLNNRDFAKYAVFVDWFRENRLGV